MKRLLITGGNGQLGQSLQEAGSRFPSLVMMPTDIKTMDITDPDSVSQMMDDFKPDCLINCAAYTAVDNAESDAEAAFRINSHGPEVLANHCKKKNIPLIHISTDYVFSGEAERPYLESDPTGPLTVYGRSKLEGELKVLRSGANALIIRTSWLYSEYGNNFLKTMIRLGESQDSIKVVSDQKGSPTYAGALASGIIHILNTYPDELRNGMKNGIYHLCNTGKCSWFDFASEIMKVYGLECRVDPVGTEEFPRPAPRPYYSVMDTTLFQKTFNYEIPSWKVSLETCIKNLKQ